MKRTTKNYILSTLIMIVLLTQLFAPCIAKADSPKGTPGTFYAFSDGGMGEPDDMVAPIFLPSNIYGCSWISMGEVDTESARTQTAKRVYDELKNMPEGKRYINLTCYMHANNIVSTYMLGTGQDGIAYVSGIWDDFFSKYKDLGGKVDFISMDYEYPWWDEKDPDRDFVKDIHDSLTVIAQKYYPDIIISSYDSYTLDRTKYNVKNVYGDVVYTSSIIGTAHTPSMYGWLRNSLETALHPATPFKAFLHDQDLMRAIRLSNPNDEICPYIGWSTWNFNRQEGEGTLAYGPDIEEDTAYYREEMIHFALTGVDKFLFWTVYPSWYRYDNTVTTQEDINLLSNLLKELDEVLGFEDRKPLNDYNSCFGADSNNVYNTKKFLISGMEAGGKNVWRVTFDRETVSRDMFKISDSPLVFQVENQKISFPEGSTVLTPDNAYGQAGYWVTSPIGTTPTVSTANTQNVTVPGAPKAPVAPPTDGVFESFFTFQYSSNLGGALNRDDFTGNVGYEFEPTVDFTITGLGRTLTGDMKNEHRITLWDVDTESEITSVNVTPGSVNLDYQGNSFKLLDTPINVKAGKRYRITTRETAGSGDYWLNLQYTSEHRNIANIKNAVYSETADSYPSEALKGEHYAYGLPVFYTGTLLKNPNRKEAVIADGMYNYFSEAHIGTRNDFNGKVGFEFTANEDITVSALGRAVCDAMKDNHTIEIWELTVTYDNILGKLLASAVVTPSSPIDSLGYRYTKLPESVTLKRGSTYRIMSTETYGGDKWLDKTYTKNFRSDISSINYSSMHATNLGECYAWANDYENGAFKIMGGATFYTTESIPATIELIEAKANGSKLDIKSQIRSVSGNSQSLKLIYTVEDSDGRILSVDVQDMTFDGGETKPNNFSLELPENSSQINLFVWDNDYIKPMSTKKSNPIN